MSFEAEGTLNLTVPQRQLDAVKRQIEDTVGTTEVGMTDGGTMSAQTARGSGRARRRARRSYRMEETRTDLLDEAVTYLEGIDDKLDTLGGGGGGLANELIAATAETGGDAAVEGAGTTIDTLTDALTSSLGSTVGNLVGGELSASLDKPGWVPIALERPKWVPLAVEDPGTISIADPPTAGVEDPGKVGFEKLPGPVSVEDPSPLSVEEVEPLEVEDVDAIPVEVTVSAPSARTGPKDSSPKVTSPSQEGNIGFGEAVGGTALFGATTGATAGMMGGPIGVGAGAVLGGALGAAGGATAWGIDQVDEDVAGWMNNRGRRGSGRGQTQGVQVGSAGGTTVNVDVSARNDVLVEPNASDIADEVASTVEDRLGKTVDELERELQDVEDRLSSVENSLQRGR